MKRKSTNALVFVLAAAALAAGCKNSLIRLTMDVPGEFKLSDISKIAIVDFNSLPGDPFGDSVAADADTCALVQRAVAAAIAQSHAWEVARLDVEQAVAAFDQGVLPNRRFDAIAYGRVWWQFPPERDVMKPALFNLQTKTRVTYTVQVPATTLGAVKGVGDSLKALTSALGGGSQTQSQQPASQPMKLVEKQIDLVTRTEDVLEQIGHRSREAMLMLALSIYRVRADGTIEKIVDTFVAQGQVFELDNSEYSSALTSFGSETPGNTARTTEAGQERQEGTTVLPSHLATIPSDMQARLMLAVRVADEIGKRLTPHKVVRVVPYVFSDKKLHELLKNRAYSAAERYALRSIHTALGLDVALKVPPLEAYGKPKYHVEPSSAADIEATSGPDAGEAVERLVVKRECEEALFALGLCQEALGRAEEALYTYRYVFRIGASSAAAEGIARCHDALGNAARLAEQSKSTRKASARSSLD